jgi:multidrug efflux pump subunit AcrA (membrane-fusion protein)
VKKGQRVLLRSAIQGTEPINTTISFIMPMADPTSRSFEAVVYFKNPGNWHPGTSVYSTITIRKKRPVLLIPYHSVVIRNGKPIVFIINKDKAKRKEVTLGSYYKQHWIKVLKGLKLNERVVTDGAAFLTDGERVTVYG